jgi:hypothetical protein
MQASGHGRMRAIEMKHTVMNHESKSYKGIEIMGMICEQGCKYNSWNPEPAVYRYRCMQTIV